MPDLSGGLCYPGRGARPQRTGGGGGATGGPRGHRQSGCAVAVGGDKQVCVRARMRIELCLLAAERTGVCVLLSVHALVEIDLLIYACQVT